MKNYSIWLDGMEESNVKVLNEDKDVDVIIIGGGITGLSVAYNLFDSNLKVCLVERNLVGHGVSSRTTGKLTYLQELIYSKLNKNFNTDKVRLYLNSQKDAIKIVKDIVDKYKIDCDLKRVDSYVYTNIEKEVKNIENEKDLLDFFGIDVFESKTLPNNKKCKKAIYVKDTYVFHPLKYIYGLKKIVENKIDIYEKTCINKVEKENNNYICKTDKYKIKAKKVVFATHYPYFLIPYLFPLKCYLEKSYITAFKLNKTYNFSAITSSKPVESIRYHNNYEIYLSNSHNLCVKNDDKNNFKKVMDKIDIKPDFIWSNKDIITSDNIPYIGTIDENMYISTGYNTWGMTNSAIGGKIIGDLILSNKNKYIKLFSPNRSLNIFKIMNFPLNISSNIKSFVGSKINKNKSWYKNIKFKKIEGKEVGIYIDENKKEHIVYNKCPHLKCGLTFNEVEKTWDCCCHGSRFDIDGNCIEGPSNYSITYKK